MDASSTGARGSDTARAQLVLHTGQGAGSALWLKPRSSSKRPCWVHSNS
jgi:hypothetical protein